MSGARIALVSRELFPLAGGGIGQFVNAAATFLAQVAEVTVFTSSHHAHEYHRLRALCDPRLPGPDVEICWVDEPSVDVVRSFMSHAHAYSARAYEALQRHYGDARPDLIEFPDYMGEAFVTLQAADTHASFLRDTVVCVRMHTTSEMCAVLDGRVTGHFSERCDYGLERFSLAHADRLIWQGGDILGSYQRFYGADCMADDVCIRYPFRGAEHEPASDSDFAIGEKARLLYIGRLERRKGVHHLVEAVRGIDLDTATLTIVGGDTSTAPLGQSMRELLQLSVADDARIELLDEVAREDLPALIRSHDAVVIPSLWECWPYVALEAMKLNRPVLATPVGGLCEMIAPGASGWITSATDTVAIDEALRPLFADPSTREDWGAMVRKDSPRARVDELTREGEILDSYERMLAGPRPRRARPKPPPPSSETARVRRVVRPLVSAVVPYYGMARYVRETVVSLFAQTYRRLEVIVVNDGSFEEQDWLLAELASSYPLRVLTQQNSGLSAARNFGIKMSRGRFVLPLDADNLIEPEFVERCVTLLEERPDLSYVTSWSRYIDAAGTEAGDGRGWQPLSNTLAVNAQNNVAGDAAAVFRRRVFDIGHWYDESLTSFEDWHHYRRLAAAGYRGAVIPERLVRYRIRDDSMLQRTGIAHREAIYEEIETRLSEERMQWTPSSA